MSDDSLLSHEEILDELEQLHRDRKTGIARIATSDNHLLQIGFEDGEIVSVAMGLKQGQEAIKLFNASARTGRLKFSEGKVRPGDGSGLPPTAETLRLFGLTRTRGAPVTLTPDQAKGAISIIEREAVEFLGPMASIIWNEQLAKIPDLGQPGAIQALIDALAREIGGIGDAAKARLFRNTVEKKLAG